MAWLGVARRVPRGQILMFCCQMAGWANKGTSVKNGYFLAKTAISKRDFRMGLAKMAVLAKTQAPAP